MTDFEKLCLEELERPLKGVVLRPILGAGYLYFFETGNLYEYIPEQNITRPLGRRDLTEQEVLDKYFPEGYKRIIGIPGGQARVANRSLNDSYWYELTGPEEEVKEFRIRFVTYLICTAKNLFDKEPEIGKHREDVVGSL